MTLTLHMTPFSLVADSKWRFGDVILVKFPFTNQLTTKQRPAVVVSGSSYNASRRDVVILAITSQMAFVGDFAHGEVIDWKSAGLLKPSLLKPVIATVEQKMIVRRLGSLTKEDCFILENVLALVRSVTVEENV